MMALYVLSWPLDHDHDRHGTICLVLTTSPWPWWHCRSCLDRLTMATNGTIALCALSWPFWPSPWWHYMSSLDLLPMTMTMMVLYVLPWPLDLEHHGPICCVLTTWPWPWWHYIFCLDCLTMTIIALYALSWPLDCDNHGTICPVSVTWPWSPWPWWHYVPPSPLWAWPPRSLWHYVVSWPTH